MQNLAKDFREFIELLNSNEVEYLVVGGFAVGFHGYPRATGDIDIWINPTSANSRKILLVLKDFGFDSLQLKEDDFITSNQIIQLGFPPLRIDILTSLDGVNFTDSFMKKEVFQRGDFKINIISRDDLIKNKLASGRTQDLADAERLRFD